MISAKDYFEQYLSWARFDSNLRSAKKTYESFSSMDLQTLDEEARQASPGALEELGERYLFGLDGLSADADKALELFRQAARLGHPDAMHMMAEVHRTAEYGKQDYELYFDYLQKAAIRGSWKAMFNLACANYKGKDAYEGHGPEADRLTALKWSIQCSIMTMELLELYFTNSCAEQFSDYMQGVFSLFVQSVCVSARQLILGDGVDKDVAFARTMLTDAQNFYQKYFKADCSDFTTLLRHCDDSQS